MRGGWISLSCPLHSWAMARASGREGTINRLRNGVRSLRWSSCTPYPSGRVRVRVRGESEGGRESEEGRVRVGGGGGGGGGGRE